MIRFLFGTIPYIHSCSSAKLQKYQEDGRRMVTGFPCPRDLLLFSWMSLFVHGEQSVSIAGGEDVVGSILL